MQPTKLLSAAAIALAAMAVAPAQAQQGAGRSVVVDPGATRKICQLTGQTDRSTGRPTLNATESRARFWGTDLGSSFQHDGKTVFLFGDTHAAAGLERRRDRDMLATSVDADPEDCLRLDFVTDADGGYRPLAVAGVDGGEFSVPTGGFSANGALYVALTTGKSADSPMARSVLAKSTNGGRDFQPLYELSGRHFINAAFAKPADRDGLPADMDRPLLVWGSGKYRASDVRLAVMSEDHADQPGGLRYFVGTDAQGQPRWSADEGDSAPLLDQACVGELSVAWSADIGKWVMMYNCGAPARIVARTADRAWGPWSAEQVVFDATANNGFCRFMHDPKGGCGGALSDPHSPQVAGDPYAPYMIAGMTKGQRGRHADIYFLMSTWNPYNVVLMTARLKLEEGGQPTS